MCVIMSGATVNPVIRLQSIKVSSYLMPPGGFILFLDTFMSSRFIYVYIYIYIIYSYLKVDAIRGNTNMIKE